MYALSIEKYGILKLTLHITCYVQILRLPAAYISTPNNVASWYSETALAVSRYTHELNTLKEKRVHKMSTNICPQEDLFLDFQEFWQAD
jgi:hypothetical protein